MELREDVIEAMVKWRLEGKSIEHDPDREMWRLVNDATFQEMIEAMKRLAKRTIQ